MNRLEVVRQTVWATVEECFPLQIEELPSLWNAWLAAIEDHGESSTGPSMSVRAVGATHAQSFEAFATILTVNALFEHLPVLGKSPPPERVRDALNAAGLALGFEQYQLDAFVPLVAPRVAETFGTVISPVRVARDAEPRLWVHIHRPNVPASQEPKSQQQADALLVNESFDLVVDEPRQLLIGKRSRVTKLSKKRELIGLWLALAHTGKTFGHEEIEAAMGGEKRTDSAHRKHVSFGNDLLRRLTGRAQIIQDSANSRYPVVDDWSWCWIRQRAEKESSTLSRHGPARAQATG